jgi:two-component system, NarL family, response regulator DegU
MSSQWIAEVFLLAENRLLRDALIRLLAKKTDIRVVGANPYSPAVHEEIIAARPSIIVLDSSGLVFSNARLISTLHASIPKARVVMVDMDSDESTFLRAVREGVVGYVLKDASATEVAATIRAVASGEAVCPPSLSMMLFRSVSQQAIAPSTFCGEELGLSRREQQLVELLRERLTNKEIAGRLNLSEQTVKNHVHNILRKVGVTDRLAIVKRCEMEPPQSSAGSRA